MFVWVGVIEFEVETEESGGSGPGSVECVRSETPVYSEEAAASLLATGRKRRARATSEPVVIVSDAREQNLHGKEPVECTGSVNRGFARFVVTVLLPCRERSYCLSLIIPILPFFSTISIELVSNMACLPLPMFVILLPCWIKQETVVLSAAKNPKFTILLTELVSNLAFLPNFQMDILSKIGFTSTTEN